MQQQDFNDVIVTHLRSDPQRGGTIVAGSVRLGTGGQQQLQDRVVAILSGDEKRGGSVLG